MTVKEARVNAGITQAEMSKRFDIPTRTIENWERGLRKPPAYVEKLLIKELSNTTVFDESIIDINDTDEDFNISFCVETDKESDIAQYFDSVEEAVREYRRIIDEESCSVYLELYVTNELESWTTYLAKYER
jgi:transcriptional regulator with XRE-family HTH domain